LKFWIDYKLGDNVVNPTFKQVVLACYFLFSFLHNRTKHEKILCVIKQLPHELGMYSTSKSIASKYCNISALKVLQYHMQY